MPSVCSVGDARLACLCLSAFQYNAQPTQISQCQESTVLFTPAPKIIIRIVYAVHLCGKFSWCCSSPSRFVLTLFVSVPICVSTAHPGAESTASFGSVIMASCVKRPGYHL